MNRRIWGPALEAALAARPNHPEAIHFYIQAVEALKQSERAEATAARQTLAGLWTNADTKTPPRASEPHDRARLALDKPDQARSTKVVIVKNISEAKARLSSLLKEVQKGREVLIANIRANRSPS